MVLYFLFWGESVEPFSVLRVVYKIDFVSRSFYNKNIDNERRKEDFMRSTHCLPSYSFGGHEVFDAIPKFTKLYGKSVAIIDG